MKGKKQQQKIKEKSLEEFKGKRKAILKKNQLVKK